MQHLSDTQGKSDSAALGPCFVTEQDPGLFAAPSSSWEGSVARLCDVLQCKTQSCVPRQPVHWFNGGLV